MSDVPNRETFESMYAGKADRVTGAVLDAGCGTGEKALFFAGRGHPVLGIDFLEGPILEARRKAGERNLALKARGQSPSGSFEKHLRSVVRWQRSGRRGSRSSPTWRTSRSARAARRRGS